MAGTTNFGPVTLSLGSRSFGPIAVADADTTVVLSVSRTVASGLDATPAAHIDLAIEQSDDGGATWYLVAAAGIDGGPQLDKFGNPLTANRVLTTWNPGTSRQARATITVTGAAVAVAGSLVTS